MDYTHLRDINELLSEFIYSAGDRGINIKQPRLNEIVLCDQFDRGYVRLIATSDGIDVSNYANSHADGNVNQDLCNLCSLDQLVYLFDGFCIKQIDIPIGIYTQRALELQRL